MKDIRAIIARFPEREFQIRRCVASDAQFRSVCADYEEAAAALRRWQEAGDGKEGMTEEYSRFLAELEREILAKLDRVLPQTKHS